jgi:hypothetical protein
VSAAKQQKGCEAYELVEKPPDGYIYGPGCGGKPAWVNQNRMSSSRELASFAARVRRFIRAHSLPAEESTVDIPSFNQLALDLFALQFEANPAYRRFCEGRAVRPGGVDHWTHVPAVPTAAFKEWEMSCVPAEERTTVFYSSGTTGQQASRHFHSAESLELYEASSLGWFGAYCPVGTSQSPIADSQVGSGWHVVSLTPPPAQAPHSSLVHMFETMRRKIKAGEAAFVGRVGDDGGWSVDVDAAVKAVHGVSANGKRLLMLGTAFSYVHLLDCLGERGSRFALPAGSCALETGGYKGRSRALPRETLHRLISQRLGIRADHIVCEYGMSELSSQAYDCAIPPARNTQHAARGFHFPPWARVQVVSPETGREVDEGESGLIRVFDLANVWSVMAVQTEDLAVRRGAGFELIGRAAQAEARGCSLMAV